MESVLQLAEGLMASPWLFVLVLALAAFDGIAPIVPAETVVITAGAFAVTGDPHAPLLMLAAWAGALLGDVLAHHIGRGAGPLTAWLRRHRSSAAVVERTEQALRSRGGTLIIAARFVPGGRTAVNVTSGAIAYPRARFALFSAIAALAWSLYYVGIGMLGGAAFGQDPLLGVALGIGLAVVLGGLIELGRSLRRRRARCTGPTGAAALTRRRSAAPVVCPAPARDGS
ncbi:DedA family protein [Brachybacterium sp. AOP43-C2-M15]|uniref:DedA family protein n=1 Tax=Brachybacterium sp. AOP43-C2-M15 TaxID=3457661 RepID=UPI0040349E47